eukprot:330711_1
MIGHIIFNINVSGKKPIMNALHASRSSTHNNNNLILLILHTHLNILLLTALTPMSVFTAIFYAVHAATEIYQDWLLYGYDDPDRTKTQQEEYTTFFENINWDNPVTYLYPEKIPDFSRVSIIKAAITFARHCKHIFKIY